MSSLTSNLQRLTSSQFPPLLREIADPPKQLYIKGSYPDVSMKFLTVVGSRMYTSYGRQACESLIRGLAGYPIVIISGLALGIDGIAHQTALDAGLLTVAVPGSGLDDRVLYPAAHRTLAHKILDAGGALVSELAPMEKAQSWTFPRRNRIMVGLSHAVLVIEAEIKSGTLITARLAADYSRDVLAVPGPIQSSTSKGPHMLIKKGAALIDTSEDILEALGFNIDEAKQPQLRFDVSTNELLVVSLLKDPLPRDELVRRLGKPASEASILLSSLELKGVITERLGLITLV
jgi:DNA processing protein